MTVGLTHADASGAARMVDVSDKEVTVRTAVAAGRLRTSPRVVELLRGSDGGLPKGDALAVARIAGIAGAKRTPDLVPLCHPVTLHAVTVDLDVTDDGVSITVTARTADRTGIEMEALTGVVVAGLALVDMVKAVDRGAVLTDVRVVEKSGGRSGTWRRPDGAQPSERADDGAGGRVGGEARAGAAAAVRLTDPDPDPVPVGTRAAVVTASNRSAAGIRQDTSGPLVAEELRAAGCAVDGVVVVPDDVERIRAAVRSALEAGARVVVTTGGTGVTPTDVTPEAVGPLLERALPGLADAMRSVGRAEVPTTVLSRGVAGTVGAAAVISLPGSPGGVRDGMRVLVPVLGHLLTQLAGGDHRSTSDGTADGVVR